MSVLFSGSIGSIPCTPIVKASCLKKEQHQLLKTSPFGVRVFPVGLGTGIQPIVMNRPKRMSSTTCFAALNARCGAEQTQTVTREAPTITQAPTHIQEKSPQLDDGGTGFPPRDDGDGGGGGGGGGGNWSGGFFFFGFLAFLGFLKDKESEGEYDYNSSKRR